MLSAQLIIVVCNVYTYYNQSHGSIILTREKTTVNTVASQKKGPTGSAPYIRLKQRGGLTLKLAIFTSLVAIHFSETSSICPVRILNHEIWQGHR